jgi:hypothetical protein
LSHYHMCKLLRAVDSLFIVYNGLQGGFEDSGASCLGVGRGTGNPCVVLAGVCRVLCLNLFRLPNPSTLYRVPYSLSLSRTPTLLAVEAYLLILVKVLPSGS